MNFWMKEYIKKYPSFFKIKEYSSNDLIYQEGDKCKEIGFVLSGEVVISSITYNEKEETINVVYEGDMFGSLLIFTTEHIYLGNIIANRKTSLAIISKENLLKLFLIDQTFLEKYLNAISNDAILIKKQAKLFSHKNIEDRIMYYFSTFKKNNIVKIKNVTELARHLSLPRPSVSRSLSLLEEKGMIKKEKNIIYIKNSSKF